MKRILVATFFMLFVALTFESDVSVRVFAEEKFDVVIINGRIIDGTGNPWFRADVGIKNGRITYIGRIARENASKIIDANNKIVAPGFIDVHTHVEDVFDIPSAENFVRMGVTTLVTGNCGGSVVDVKGFLGNFEKTPAAVNLATLIGHNSVRRKIMRLENRAPTTEEQTKMEALVEQAMKDGAVGFSTGLIYLPGTFAKTDEVVALAKVASRYGGVYATHMRDEGTEVMKAIEESIFIAEEAKMPLEISHFKISSKKLWGESDKTIGLVRAARERGLSVTVDEYAYTASSTSLESRIPSWAIAGGRDEARKRLDDPTTRKTIIAEMKDDLKKKKFKDYSFAYVASYQPNTEFNGMNIAEITKKVSGKNKLDAQIEQIFAMYLAGGAGMVYHVMDEEDVKRIMREPFTMIASDSGVRRFEEGVPHPRGYGNNARVLGRYVRDLGIVTLEDAIRKMTSLPAQTFNLRDRGQIREGMAADIVIFDEKSVADLATYEKPHQYAKGFSYVLVNGEIALDENGMTGNRPGQPIYGNVRRTASSSPVSTSN